MDRQFFAAAGLEAGQLREFIATGADDSEVMGWMSAHARAPRERIVNWGRRFQANPLWRLLDFEDWLHQRRYGKNARMRSTPFL
jgi:hypothetical protein